MGPGTVDGLDCQGHRVLRYFGNLCLEGVFVAEIVSGDKGYRVGMLVVVVFQNLVDAGAERITPGHKAAN